jgi:4-amino-4-deoxy-L-arabinose transferase-like glycosyltransferase
MRQHLVPGINRHLGRNPFSQRKRVSTGINWPLVALLILALALRLPGIVWGLPLDPYTGYYHPDEGKIVRAVQDFPRHILTIHDLRYPTFYPYSIAIITWPLRPLILQAATLAGIADETLAYYLLVRLCTIIWGTLTAWAVYLLARRLYGQGTGLVAALFIALAMTHVSNSSFATTDVPSSLVAVVALFACYRVADDPRPVNYLLMGIASGALIGTKYPGFVILAPAFLAHAIAAWDRRGQQRWPARDGMGVPAFMRWLLGAIFHPWLWLYLALAAVSFLLTTPAVALRPHDMFASFQLESDRLARLSELRWSLAAWWEGIWRLNEVLGFALGLASMIGVARALYRPSRREVLLLAFVGLYYLYLVGDMRKRYLLMVLPFFCILAARWLIELSRLPHVWQGLPEAHNSYLLQRRGRRGRIISFAFLAASAVIFFVALSALILSLAAIYTRLTPDPRTQAARYLTALAPEGSSLGFGPVENCGRGDPPPVYRERYILTQGLAGPDYLVLEDCHYERMEDAWNKGDMTVYNFYDDVLNSKKAHYSYTLLAEFRNEKYAQLDFAPPDVWVYRNDALDRRLFTPPGEIQHPMALRLGDMIGFLGYDLEQQAAKPGGTLRLTLYWQARGRIYGNYKVFTHLLDGQEKIWGQMDDIPVNTTRPTPTWVKGEVIVDTYEIPVATDALPGTYLLEAGMYDGETGERLPVIAEDGRPLPGARIVLGEVQVEVF